MALSMGLWNFLTYTVLSSFSRTRILGYVSELPPLFSSIFACSAKVTSLLGEAETKQHNLPNKLRWREYSTVESFY